MSLWQRLDVIVNDPICRTFGEDYNKIEWNDPRPLPTEAELQSVTQAQIDARDPVKIRQALKDSISERKPVYTIPELTAEINTIKDLLGL